MDFPYESTERYTVEHIVDMGVELNRVTNTQGMVVAILNNEEFANQFKLA